MPSETEISIFLSDPASYPERPVRVDVIETHAARVFLAGTHAIKVKKHVRLPYLDFTTLAQREMVLRRELELNQPAAPDIYLGLKRITSDGGRLTFDGKGETIEETC
jgi:aminoglycoside phosphotransferase family enzyme